MPSILQKIQISYILPLIFSSLSYSATLSDSARISVLTCSPGNETYSLFGHTAIRVVDPVQNLDIVFNYGTFDFSTPNFYLKFIRGRLDYMLSVSTFNEFLAEYIYENRSVYEQELIIPHSSKEVLFNNLLENYRPENRYYRYDFFYDNCATRVRDMIDESLDIPIQYDYSDYRQELSFRQLIDPYLAASPWLDVGIDIALGLPADRIATPWQYMFLPDYIMTIYDKAMIREGNGSRSFCSNIVTVFEAEPGTRTASVPRPGQVFWALFLVALLSAGIETGRKAKWIWFDRILFLALGLLGTLLVAFWIFSDHIPLAANLNMLWAFPFHLIAVFFLRRGANPAWLRIYFLAAAVSVLALLISLPWTYILLPQLILPVLLTVFLRLAVESHLLSGFRSGRQK